MYRICGFVAILEDVALMVITTLPENLESMGLSCYIEDAMQLIWAVIGAEGARMAKS